MITVCIGYDPAETVAYHVLCHSILRHSTVPVRFIPINKKNIPEFKREKEDGSTEFSFSRFLTPYLCGYQGQAIFMDCDMLVTCDLSEILSECDLYHDVFVVKHDYTPKPGIKFLGNQQHVYPKKNWSSVMVFNCFMPACKRLTAEAASNKTGKYLHQFEWTAEPRIGELGKDWNHLVGEYEENPNAKIVHYTLGTPCFKGYENQEWAKEWFKEKELMNYAYN
jgi:hypothetical protein